MPQHVADEFMEHIPKKAPSWAIGFATIILAVGTTIVTLYLFSRDDVKQFIGWAETHHEQSDMAELRRHEEMDAAVRSHYETTMTAIIGIANTNTAQMVDLSKSLGIVQQQNITLSNRVTALEGTLQSIKDALVTCERDLKECRKR